MASEEDDAPSQENNKKKQLIRSNAMCGDDDTRLKPPSRFDSVKTRSSTTSSRESNVEYTDSTGIDLYQFIVNTLHKNPKDREMLLNLEAEMRKFVLDTSKQAYKFPKMSSYNRMLVHRVAAFFGLDHNVDQSGSLVVVTKTTSTRVPDIEFEKLIKSNIFTDRVFHRRDVHSFDESRLNACLLGYPPSYPYSGAAAALATAPVNQLDAMRRARSFEVGEWHNSMANMATPSSGGVAGSRQLSASSVHSMPQQAGPVPLASIVPLVPGRSRHNSMSPVIVEPIMSPVRTAESPTVGYAPQTYYSPSAMPLQPAVVDEAAQEEDGQSMYSNAASQPYYNPYQWASAESYASSTELSPQPPAAYVPFYQDGVQYMYPTGYAGAMPYYYPTSQTYGPMEQPPGTVYYAADGTVYAPTAMFQSPSSGYSTDNGELGPLEGQLGAMSLNAGSNGSPAANVDGESSTEPPAGTSTPLLTYSTPAFRYYTSASGPYPQQLPSNVTYAQSQQPYSTAAYNAGGYSSAQPLFDAQYASAASTYQPPYQTSYTGSGAYPYASFASAYTATTSDGLYAGGQSTAASQHRSFPSAAAKPPNATPTQSFIGPKSIEAKTGTGQYAP